MFVLLFLYLAPQGAVGQPQAQGLPYPRLIGAAEHRAVRPLGQGVAAAQDLQWAEGIQRRGQRAEAAVLDICHHTHGGTEPVGHMVHILAAVRQVSSRVREDAFFRQGL